jgi:hypothetical protein
MNIYLYVKQHSVTKLKYFGKTIKPDPYKYNGSGTYWSNHFKKHGKDHIKTLEVWGFDDQELCTEFALKFSEEHNIVESPEWANMVPENAVGGGQNKNMPMTTEQKNKISETRKTLGLGQISSKYLSPKNSADNGKKSAYKQSQTVTGRKLISRKDGTKYWVYPDE